MTSSRTWRAALGTKAAVAGAVVVLADQLFFAHRPGSTVGVFALVWMAGVWLVRPGLFRDRRAALASFVAGLLAVGMIDRPSLLLWLLFALALTIAALSARVADGEPGWRWSQRLIVHLVVAMVGPVIDMVRRMKARRRRGASRGGAILRVAGLVALPLWGGLVFLGLFASANPLISDILSRLRPPALSVETVVRTLFCGLVALSVWAALRPRWRGKLLRLPSLGERALPGVSAASVTLSLIVFNLVFALQNGLDIAFLWSGAPLPHGVTLADYAHRGAYPLILTALVAGAFVLITLRPGSETASRPLVRGLVTAWVAQNMLLVASSLLRTVDYVEVFSLTRLRLAAIIWMVLVGLGLLLICWRLLRNRSAHWLINANLLTTLTMLAAVGVVNLGPTVAAWNVRHAAEVDGSGAVLDLCYMRKLGPAGLVSLAELERSTQEPLFKARIASARWQAQQTVMERQSHWRGWTWRDARRLAKAQSLVGWEKPDLGLLPRDCNGDPFETLPPPPSPPVVVTAPIPPAAPLTSNAGH